MADIIAALERARRSELAVSAAMTDLERLRGLAQRIQYNPEYALSTLEKVRELDRELNAQIDKLADAKAEALKYISILEGEERGVIERHYMLGMKWDKIADAMYMSERRVYILRKNALAKMEKQFGTSTNRRDYGNREKASAAP